MFKAADNRTDIYATIFYPSDFLPQRRYAVVDVTYPRGTTPVGAFRPGQGMAMYVGAAIVELGCIAVSMETRGSQLRDSKTSSFRDLRFSYGYHDRFCHIDRIAGLRQLAVQRSYIDIDHVGVFRHVDLLVPAANSEAQVGWIIMEPEDSELALAV